MVLVFDDYHPPWSGVELVVMVLTLMVRFITPPWCRTLELVLVFEYSHPPLLIDCKPLDGRTVELAVMLERAVTRESWCWKSPPPAESTALLLAPD